VVRGSKRERERERERENQIAAKRKWTGVELHCPTNRVLTR